VSMAALGSFGRADLYRARPGAATGESHGSAGGFRAGYA